MALTIKSKVADTTLDNHFRRKSKSYPFLEENSYSEPILKDFWGSKAILMGDMYQLLHIWKLPSPQSSPLQITSYRSVRVDPVIHNKKGFTKQKEQSVKFFYGLSSSYL